MLTLAIPGMKCGGCAKGVTAAIRSVDPDAELNIDLEQKTVAVETGAAAGRLIDALAAADFEATRIDQEGAGR